MPSGTTSVTWQGAQGTDACGRLWYDTSAGPGRAQLRATRGLPAGADFWEQATPALAVPRRAPCEVAYGSEFQNAWASPIASKDAMMMSRSWTGGGGPYLGAAATTEWGPGSTPAPTPAGTWFRSHPVHGGGPAAGGATPGPSPGALVMPAPLPNRESSSTCVFTGPTRIHLNYIYAYVTSPGTAAPTPSSCVGTVDTTVSGKGLVNFKILLTPTTVFYVRDGTPGGDAGPTNPLFNTRTITTQQVGNNQPATFYAELGTTESALKSTLVAAAYTATTPSALAPWLAALEAAKVPKVVGTPGYQAVAMTPSGAPGSLNPSDPLLEQDASHRTAAMIQRRACTAAGTAGCTAWSAWTSAFSVTNDSRTFPMAQDVTRYQSGSGTAFVDGSMGGRLTVAAQRDVVITGVIDNYDAGGATALIGLVAGNGSTPGSDVEIYHPVRCLATTPVTAPGGTCPNDLTGLTSAPLAFTDPAHPARQYVNLYAPGKSDIGYVKAVILAHDGCFCVQNFMRGAPLGPDLVVKGSIYQRHHGEIATYYGSRENRTGYPKLYVEYNAAALNPPTAFAGSSGPSTPPSWAVVGIAEQQGGA